MGSEREEVTVARIADATVPAPTRPTLTVGRVDDPAEREADSIADQVVRVLGAAPPESMLARSAGRVQRASQPPSTPPSPRTPVTRIQRKLRGTNTPAIAATPVPEIEAIDAKQLDGEAYHVLHDEMGQSWSEAKHVLAAGKLPEGETTPEQSAALKAMMQKLWDFRKWHHELVLTETQRRVNAETNDPNGLKNWNAAGSASLTSDIDVNLKGTHTELAVKIFNETFKEFGWDYEAGVVYDVNVYAVDFMHGMGQQTDQGLVVSEEGKRSGRDQGGIGDGGVAAWDQGMQREWTLVKTRLYMTPAEWADFKDASGGNGWDAATFTRAEARFDEYRTAMLGKMGKEVEPTLTAADEAQKTGSESIREAAKQGATSEGQGEDAAMAASNRLYEEKLEQVASYREALTQAVARYDLLVSGKASPSDKGPDLEQVRLRIDGLLLELRDLLSECSLFANEAYLTHGAVNHGVVGLQIGKPIAMTNSAMYDAFQENMADALKEIARHDGSIGEAAYKSGKYIWRMADAADNLGVTVEEKRWLLTAGGQIANEIKNKKDVDVEAESARLVKQWLGVSTVAELRQAVIGFGMIVGAQFNQQIGDERRAEKAKPVDKENWKR